MIRERFELTTMEGQQMKDFKGTLGKCYIVNAKDCKITKYKVFKYNIQNKLKIMTYEDMNEMQEQEFYLLKRSFSKFVYSADPLYTGPCAINSKKVKDVQSLARYILKEDSRNHMRSLIKETPLW